jgi:hypothetical protein
MDQTQKHHDRKAEEREGFFARIFGFGADAEHRRGMRVLKRELSSAKVDLYKMKQDLIQVPVARIIHDLYKYTYPLKQLLPLDKKSMKLAPSFIDLFLRQIHGEFTAKDLELSEAKIEQMVTQHGMQKTRAHLDHLLEENFDRFDQAHVDEINNVYSSFLAFVRFAHFDFFPILREFDLKLEEGSFARKPSFSPAEGSLLREDLFQLRRAIFSLRADEDIDRGMKAFKEIKTVEAISPANLDRLKKLLRNMQDHDYLGLIVRGIDRNAEPLPFPKPLYVDIFSKYSIKRKGDAHGILNSIESRMRNEAVEELESGIFSGDKSGVLKNYTEPKSSQLKGFGVSGYRHVRPLSYVYSFVTEVYQGKISEAVNELIVGGIFINKGFLTALSNSYYALNKLPPKVTRLEQDLDVDGASAEKINRHLARMQKDKNSRIIVERTIQAIDTQAELIIAEAIVNLKDMARCLKNIIEDYKRDKPSYVANIKKIRPSANRDLMQNLVDCYKNIFQFMRLLGKFVSIKVTREEFEKKRRQFVPTHG